MILADDEKTSIPLWKLEEIDCHVGQHHFGQGRGPA